MKPSGGRVGVRRSQVVEGLGKRVQDRAFLGGEGDLDGPVTAAEGDAHAFSSVAHSP